MKRCIVIILILFIFYAALSPMGANAAANQADGRFHIWITVGDQDFSAELYDNETTRAWVGQLPMTLAMNELNGNEKYHYFSENLPTNPERPDAIHTGDLMLYGQSCLVLFYKDFVTSYSYTPLGYVEDATGFAKTLGDGNVTVSFRLDEGNPADEKEEQKPVKVRATQKIILNYKSATMRAGDTLDLNVAWNTGVKTSKKVTWKSSNKKIASVDKKGIVKAKKKGTVTITATTKDKKAKASCKIKVQKKQASKTKVLVAYFSCTNTTKGVAEKIADVTGGDLYRITPAKKYTSGDLNYNNERSRAAKEQNNKKIRPQMKGKTVSMKNYDIVFLGYPIWFEDAPRIISTFVESYDFKGTTVVPFCTSGSSGIGKSASGLAKPGKGTWLKGRRFSGNVSSKTIEKWIQGLGILEGTDEQGADSVMNIKVGKKVFKAKLEDFSFI